MPIDWNKPVQTRGGQKVTILKTGVRGEFSVVGILHAEDEDIPHAWKPDGSWHMTMENGSDLINVPEERFGVLFNDGTSLTDTFVNIGEARAWAAKYETNTGFLPNVVRLVPA